jgi:hypothetical protein
MNKTHRPSLRQLITADTAATQRPDEMMLAAWLEGRLPESQAEQVEVWLCHDPALRQALMNSEHAGPLPLSAAELAQAVALVTSAEEERTSWFDWIFAPVPVWAMAGMIAVLGFWLGSGLGSTPDRDARLLAIILTGAPL